MSNKKPGLNQNINPNIFQQATEILTKDGQLAPSFINKIMNEIQNRN